MTKQYILKNKDREVLWFETAEKSERLDNLSTHFTYIANVKIINNNLLPYDFVRQENNSLKDNLKEWINKRKVPKNRAFVNNILSTLEMNEQNNLMAYIDISLGLSLNDSYWIIPAHQKYLWKDYNLYENSFNETLALVAFTGYSTKISGITTSPEYTTNGMLKKCWHKNKQTGKIELIKGQTQEYANRGKEAYCEYYMAQIAAVLGFNHIQYDLREFHNEIVSTCEIFTNQQVGYMPIHYCMDKNIDADNTVLLLTEIMKIYGKESLQDLLLFDALIYNTDRHLGNFGMLIDNDTNQLIKPAPIFDNGLSFINLITQDELNNIEHALIKNNYNHSALKISFDEQIKFAGQKRHIPLLQKLADFTFIRHPQYNLPENWLVAAEQFIQQRSQTIIEMIEHK